MSLVEILRDRESDLDRKTVYDTASTGEQNPSGKLYPGLVFPVFKTAMPTICCTRHAILVFPFIIGSTSYCYQVIIKTILKIETFQL